jgi:hypothetical protein
MSFSNSTEEDVLQQIFVGTALPWNGNTNLWIALYTASPGEAGAHTNEATYGSYARVVLTRATDFSISGNSVSNANLEQFAACTSGSNVITHAAIVDSGTTGAGNVIVYAALNSSITVSTGVQPQFAAGALSFTLD